MPGQILNNLGYRKDHIRSMGILTRFTIQRTTEPQLLGITYFFPGNQVFAQRQKLIQTFPHKPLAGTELNIPTGKIVGDTIA